MNNNQTNRRNKFKTNKINKIILIHYLNHLNIKANRTSIAKIKSHQNNTKQVKAISSSNKSKLKTSLSSTNKSTSKKNHSPSLKWKATKTSSTPIFNLVHPSKTISPNSLKKSNNCNNNFFNKKTSIKICQINSQSLNFNNMESNVNPKDITNKISHLILLSPLKSTFNLKILLIVLNKTFNISKKLHHSINPS